METFISNIFYSFWAFLAAFVICWIVWAIAREAIKLLLNK